MPHAAHTGAAANRRGILYMATGMAALVLNDTVMKYVGQSLGLAQMLSVRGMMAIVMILVVARAMGATSKFGMLANRRIAYRTVFEILGTLLYLAALMNLPIGNATAINLSAPLILAVLAVIVLKERPGKRRWFAIGIGFVGVIFVVQPRVEDFNAWALVCLAATAAGTVRDLITRYIPRNVPAILISLVGITFVTLIALAYTLIVGWQPMTWVQVAMLSVAASLLATGYFLIVNSMRHGEVTIVAPFRYTGLLVALAGGYVIWGEVPTAMAWGGILLLLCAGLYLLHDETRRNRVDVEQPLA
jgi:drug/metabolite transporter (DMT)-like permease